MTSLPAHPASHLPPSLRMHYAAALVSLVRVDGKTDDRELKLVRRLCDVLELDAWARGCVDEVRRRGSPDKVRTNLALLAGIADLRFSLMADALAFCFVDGRLAPAEKAALARIADTLGLSREQALVIARWVETHLSNKGEAGADTPLARALASALPSDSSDPASGEVAVRWIERWLGATEEEA